MREVLLRGGPVDGTVVQIEGGAWIHVPVSPEPGIADTAIYNAFTGEYNRTEPGRERDYPKCPGCGGRTMRAAWTGHCEDPDCDIVMCTEGFGPDCVLAMHSKQ